MLRVGLTGELGSGKSTVARMLASHGAIVLSSDEMARAMMKPHHPVYRSIIDHFGPSVLLPDGNLDRPALARLAFDPEHPRVEELNAIIHPAVLAEQERQLVSIARNDPHAIVVIESALIFQTKHAGGDQPWRERFDRILLVTAPDELKISRFIARVAGNRRLAPDEQAALRADALARLASQRIEPGVCTDCILIENSANAEALARRTDEVFRELRRETDPERKDHLG